MAQADAAVANGIVSSSQLNARYSARIDRESAYEMLLAKVAVPSPAEKPARADKPAPEPPAAKDDKSFVEKALSNSTVRNALRTAATAAGREIVRSIFGAARRRRR